MSILALITDLTFLNYYGLLYMGYKLLGEKLKNIARKKDGDSI